jgi:hypothetical protein
MLILIAYGLIIGFISAWTAVIIIEMTNYGAVFGFVREWIAKLLQSDKDKLFKNAILKRDINAFALAEIMNTEYYLYIAKNSKIMYVLMCKYCLSVWTLAATTLFVMLKLKIYFNADMAFVVLFALCFAYFNLSLTNKS